MALLRCTGCGNIISDRAVKCPKCGTPVYVEPPQRQESRPAPTASNSQEDIATETNSPNKTAFFAIIGIIVAALAVWGFFQLKSDDDAIQENGSSETHVEKYDGHYEWRGSVGTFGANMQLDISNGHATGLYHYDFQKKGINLSLSGECDTDGMLTLNETTPSGVNSGRFVGQLHVDGYSGTFYNLQKETTFPFSFTVGAAPIAEENKVDEDSIARVKAVIRFIENLYNNEKYEDYNFLKKHCSAQVLNQLREDYEYDTEEGYATWSFGGGAQDGPNDRHEIINVTPLTEDWYCYHFYDMGNKGSCIIKVVLKDGDFMITGLTNGTLDDENEYVVEDDVSYSSSSSTFSYSLSWIEGA